MIPIVLTGPESTGKTSMCKALAESYCTEWVPEYARGYVERLGRDYTIEDVLAIAKHQIKTWDSYKNSNSIIFFDTHLIITKVWLDLVYNKKVDWLEKAIHEMKPELYLLLKPDIEWVADDVRENGGEERDRLFSIYESELKKYGFPYQIVCGFGEERINLAKILIDNKIGS